MSDASLRASDPTQSAWVAANAGAGKTHTLANRVTRLLFAGARPERILCLTYTKAAAAEMQERLFKQLGEWSMLPDDKLRANIESIGARANDAAELRKARRLFAQALETPGGLKIQTLHAFCQNLLSRFAMEAGVPPSFRVLDDRTARDLMNEARARVLERAGSGDAPRAAAIAHIVTQSSEGRLQQLLDAALGNDRRKLEAFCAAHADPLAMTRKLRTAHGAREDDNERAIAGEFAAALDRARLAEIVAWLRRGGKTDGERAATLQAAIAAPDALKAFGLFRDALCTKEGQRRASLATKTLADGRPDLLNALNTICDRLLLSEERLRAARAAALCEATIVVADAVRDVYASEKRARGVLDYDDLIARALGLLERQDAAAWVLYKLDGGLDHVLIDEAQDTSPEQWAIVRALTEEFFSREGRHGEPRTIFVVGDEKQSIFSFQGADPRQFDVNRKLFEQRIRAASHIFTVEPLHVSRRSAPEILAFVDAVFADPAARKGLTSNGAPVEHKALRETAKGRVEVWPAEKPSDAPEIDVWRPVDVESKSSPVVRLAIKLADQIRRWTDGRTKLPGHDRAIAPGDIMILLPRREPFGSEIIRRLKERGIAVAGADRIRLNEQIAVMDLIALGRFALLPEDDLNLAALLRSPLVGLSEEELFALAHGREGHLWSELARRRGELASFEHAHGLLSGMRARADRVPPFEFYASALGTGGMRLKLLARLGHEAGDAIDEFMSLAFAFEASNTPTLEGFLHWIERGGAEIKRDMERGRDEVRVMTVHGAKGLEADIVILPDTMSVPRAAQDANLLYTEDGALYPVAKQDAPQAVLTAKQAAEERVLEEHRRLLYVALTRAKDRLYICGFEGRNGVKPESWYALCEAAAKRIGKAVEHDGGTAFVVGEAGEEAARKAGPREPLSAHLEPWTRTAAPSERASPRLIRPSEASGSEEPATRSPRDDKRFRRGLLVHALLARLPEIAPEDRHAIALKFLSAQRGIEDADSIAGETLRILNDPRFGAAFAPGSRAEAGLVAGLPELGEGARINGRIDRLAVSEDEVLIVDFKTNRPPPKTESELPQIYRTQMALYRAGARRIFPGRRIACALVWTEGPSLMPLSEAMMDAEIARIAQRLAAH
jgi:ATP-dependent helicase/nuclease subunit A